jgi:hypothetical protein
MTMNEQLKGRKERSDDGNNDDNDEVKIGDDPLS